MIYKLCMIICLVIFLSGCQWISPSDNISNSQPSVDNLNEENVIDFPTESPLEQTTQEPVEEDPVVVDPSEENEPDDNVDCPVSATLNEAVDLLQLEMSEQQLAAIIHNPSEAQLKVLDHLDVIECEQDSSGEQMLIIPQHIGSKITIYEVFYEDDKLIEKAPLLDTQIVEDKQVIDLHCIVPEGIPHAKIVVEYKEYRMEYLISYDGLGERPQVEFLEYED